MGTKNTKIKLALLCSSPSKGGLEMYTLNLATWLQEKKHDITIIAQRNSFLLKEAKKARIKTRTINKKTQYTCIPTAYKLSKILVEEKIDNVLIMSSKDIDLGAFTKSLFFKNLNLLYMQQMQLGIVKKTPYFDWKFSKLNRWYAPLTWLYEQVKKNTNIQEKQLRIIPVTIDSDRFMNNPLSKEEAREKLNLPKKGFLIGFIGRIDSKKRPDLILRAFERVRQYELKGEPLHLIVVGEKNQGAGDEHAFADNFEEMIEESTQRQAIHRFPFINNVQNMFKALDAFVMATDKETIGLVTLEAMASGTIVIGADNGGTPDLLDYGKCGHIFKSGDERDLASAMTNAYKLRDQHELMSQNAKKRVLNNFDKDIACQRIIDDIQSLSQ